MLRKGKAQSRNKSRLVLYTMLLQSILIQGATKKNVFIDNFLQLYGTKTSAELIDLFNTLKVSLEPDSDNYQILTVLKDVLVSVVHGKYPSRSKLQGFKSSLKRIFYLLSDEATENTENGLILSVMYLLDSKVEKLLYNLVGAFKSAELSRKLIGGLQLPHLQKEINEIENSIESSFGEIDGCYKALSRHKVTIEEKDRESYGINETFFKKGPYTVPHSSEAIILDLEKNIFEKCPRFNELLLIGAKVNYSLREIKKAEASLLTLLKRDTRNHEALFYKGLIFLENGKFNDAFKYFQHAFQEDDNNTTYKDFARIASKLKKLFSEADELRKKGKFEKESVLFEEFFANEDNGKILNNKAMGQFISRKVSIAFKDSADGELDQLEKALKWANSAIRCRRSVENIDNKIDILIDLDRYKDAKSTCNKAFNYYNKVKRNPDKFKIRLGETTGEESDHFRQKYSQIETDESNKGTDLYRILGVKPESNDEEIKKKYRALTLKFHPDRCSEEKKDWCSSKIAEINRAYEGLKNQQKRKEYDNERRFGGRGGRGNSGGFGGFDFSDVFGGSRRRSRRSGGSTFSFSFG
eukprot:GAHX01000204.1.p1 GENE.GAHX01000204.1~~GAHX01000204.1.p1  ORF type:complete len:582 (-),score=136.50 GAHX01000204.1:753-2498(-)